MNGKCKACGAILDQHGATREQFDDHVFAGKLVVVTTSCRSCRSEHRIATHTSRPSVHFEWQVSGETLVEGKDFQVSGRRAGCSLNGTKPLMVCWLWAPVDGDAELDRRLIEAILKDEKFGRNDADSLLVMSADSLPVDVYGQVVGRFNMTVLLQAHVMKGSFGPYPSLRAERSIMRTFSAVGLKSVRHYWPSYSLRAEDYVPLFEASELPALWGRHARKNFTIQTPEE